MPWGRRVRRWVWIGIGLLAVSVVSVAVGDFLGVPGWIRNAVDGLVVVPLLFGSRTRDDTPDDERSDERVAGQAPDEAPHERSEADAADLLAHTPALDSRSLRPLLRTLIIVPPLAVAMMAVSVLGLLYPSHSPDTPPDWFFWIAFPAVFLVCAYGGLVVAPRQYLQGRAIVRAARAGTAPCVVAVVVGEDGDKPVLRLLDGTDRIVLLRQEARVVQALGQGDLAVLEGCLERGRMVAVSTPQRRGWTRFGRFADEGVDEAAGATGAEGQARQTGRGGMIQPR